MKDPLRKRIEIWFRRLLIRLIGFFYKRNRYLPDSLDFDKCKILFIRQDRIGDVLVSTPLFEALKKYYPNSVLDIVLSENNYFVLENDPLIRKRWVYKKNIGAVIKLIGLLRKEKYDFLIDLMDNPSATSTIFCLLINAKWNIGIEKENQFAYDINVPMLSRKDTHIIDRISQLLKPFKIKPDSEKFAVRYFISKQSENKAEIFLEQNNILADFIVGINISAGNKTRFWGIENFKKLINRLSVEYPNFKFLLLYQPSDSKNAEVISNSNKQIILSPLTESFDHFAAFIKRLSLLITPDTAAVHLASAFNIKSVILYVQSNKELRIWEPRETDCECIITDVDDISTISVKQVEDAFKKLFMRTQKK
ncbi:MAG: glycosyltransferase family 9 protein [Bacteroidetes bacterium]|nr:glycosyltransferase family 9 protein [Bacteroidota bacterium]